MTTLDELLRAACRDSGKNAAEIARGIEASTKSFPRFLRGTRGLSGVAQAKLAAFLGYQITLSKALRKNRKSGE